MALGQLIVPELVARKSAGFKTHLPLKEGRQQAARGDSHFAVSHHEIEIQRAWTLPITRLLKDVFLKTGDAQPSPGLSPVLCLPAQPPLLAAASLLLGSAPPAQAALGAAELAAVGPASIWPTAVEACSAPAYRLDAVLFGEREAVYLELVIYPAAGLPVSEPRVTEPTVDTPLVAGAVPYDPRVASLPSYPSMAPLQAASVGNHIPELEFVPPMLVMRQAESAALSISGQDCAAQTAAVDGYIMSAPATMASALHRTPQLRMQLAEEPARNQIAHRLNDPTGSAGWARFIGAETTERMVRPIAAVAPVVSFAFSAPRFAGFAPNGVKQPARLTQLMPIGAAEPAARMVQPVAAVAPVFVFEVAAPAIATPAIAALKQPALTDFVALPAPEAVTRMVQPAVAEAISAALPTVLPQITGLTVVTPMEPVEVLGWMPVAAAESVTRFVQPAVAEAVAFAREIAVQGLTQLSVVSPDLPFILDWMQPSAAEMAESEVRARAVAVPLASSSPSTVVLPNGIEQIGALTDEESVRLAGAAQAPSVFPVESLPVIPDFAAIAVPVRPAVMAPVIQFPARPELSPGVFQPMSPAAFQPEGAIPNAGGARLVPISTLSVKPPAERPFKKHTKIPEPGLIPMEYFCHRLRSEPTASVAWATTQHEPALVAFAMRGAQEKLEDLLKKDRKPEKLAEVVTLPKAKVRTSHLQLDRSAKIAACLLIAAFTWLGSRAMHLSAPSSGSRGSESTIGGASDVSNNVASGGRVGPSAPATGTFAKVRRALASRASVETTDSFRNGMANWGTQAKTWAEGWSRHPDGYVRTGELALFGPSTRYTDYKLEFYGQIENKSMGWVVRAKDKENYYAMKFTVIEAGLRPIIALVHYPVVGGKRGHKVTTPLSVMVHNQQPYHVAVNVRGNRFTTSIEGEQVGSWTDTTLSAGGIGFFSEAGERARLYWMKVSKNQDFLGRICGYLAGPDAMATVAELWGPSIPPQKREPVRPAPVEMALAAGVSNGFNSFSSQRAKTSKYERTGTWNS